MNTLTVVKKNNAKKRIFKGVRLDLLAVGEKSMVCKMNYRGYRCVHTAQGRLFVI